MKRFSSLFVALAFSAWTIPSFSQELQPTLWEPRGYKEAHDLIYNSEARAKKALALLLDDRAEDPAGLNDRSLCLLCTIYNELGEFTKQLEVALLLWNRDPMSPVAMTLVFESLPFKFRSEKGVRESLEFIEGAMNKGLGNRRLLLILKAKATLARKDIADGTKRLEIADLLIEAFAIDPCPKGQINLSAGGTHNFIVDDYDFVSFFSDSERRTIKSRMLKKVDESKKQE